MTFTILSSTPTPVSPQAPDSPSADGAGAVPPLELWVRGERILVSPDAPVTVALADDRPTIEGAPTTSDIEGTVRADGSVITASMPTIVSEDEPEGLVGMD